MSHTIDERPTDAHTAVPPGPHRTATPGDGKTRADATRRGTSRTVLGVPDAATLQALADATVRRAFIDTAGAASGASERLRIGRLTFDETTIEALRLEGVTARIRCGAAMLREVRAILELDFTAHWEYDLKWLGRDAGVKPLGSKSKPVELHDIELPALGDFGFELPSVTLDDVEAEIAPLEALDLGGSDFTELRVQATEAPEDGFAVAGLDLGEIAIERVAVPATRTDSVRIGSFAPDAALTLPRVGVGRIDLPEIAIDDVSSDGAVSLLDIQLEAIEAPVFKLGTLFKVHFVIEPVLHLQFGALELRDLRATAAVDRVEVHDLSSRLRIDALEIEGLTLDTLGVDRIAV